ncbi:MAG: DUF2953 domain-containing protein [Methanococcoides sp.]|nr:DUF2953 domain-containing protein [Methanococcoides sp.]
MELMFFLYVIVLIIIFLLALILLAPIAVAFDVNGDLSGVRSNVSLKWMFLSYSFSGQPDAKEVPVTNSTTSTEEGTTKVDTTKVDTTKVDTTKENTTKENTTKENTTKEDTDHPLKNTYEMARKGYAIKGQFLHLMKGLLFQLHIRDLAFDLTYGLPDPADTGMLCGYLHTLASIARGRARSFSYSLYPVFMEEAFDVHLSGSIRFRIGSFIPPLLMFIFNVKVLKTGWWFAKNRYSSS